MTHTAQHVLVMSGYFVCAFDSLNLTFVIKDTQTHYYSDTEACRGGERNKQMYTRYPCKAR